MDVLHPQATDRGDFSDCPLADGCTSVCATYDSAVAPQRDISVGLKNAAQVRGNNFWLSVPDRRRHTDTIATGEQSVFRHKCAEDFAVKADLAVVGKVRMWRLVAMDVREDDLEVG